jgi:Multiubiquitin
MSPRSHPGSHEGPETSLYGSRVGITVTVANRYTFDTEVVTGRQIKQTAGVPSGFALYRRTAGGNEPIADDEPIVMRNGDHFFARPSADI